jgi:hypothetical protein
VTNPHHLRALVDDVRRLPPADRRALGSLLVRLLAAATALVAVAVALAHVVA